MRKYGILLKVQVLQRIQSAYLQSNFAIVVGRALGSVPFAIGRTNPRRRFYGHASAARQISFSSARRNRDFAERVPSSPTERNLHATIHKRADLRTLDSSGLEKGKRWKSHLLVMTLELIKCRSISQVKYTLLP